jgi:hypothetical protein
VLTVQWAALLCARGSCLSTQEGAGQEKASWDPGRVLCFVLVIILSNVMAGREKSLDQGGKIQQDSDGVKLDCNLGSINHKSSGDLEKPSWTEKGRSLSVYLQGTSDLWDSLMEDSSRSTRPRSAPVKVGPSWD